MICKDKFLIKSTVAHARTIDEDISSATFVKDDGRYPEENLLKVVLVMPPQSEGVKAVEDLKLIKGVLEEDLKVVKGVVKDIVEKVNSKVNELELLLLDAEAKHSFFLMENETLKQKAVVLGKEVMKMANALHRSEQERGTLHQEVTLLRTKTKKKLSSELPSDMNDLPPLTRIVIMNFEDILQLAYPAGSLSEAWITISSILDAVSTTTQHNIQIILDLVGPTTSEIASTSWESEDHPQQSNSARFNC
ncbi:hypothetical protein CCACVL1_07413 [Corchorus capsularis]|uniref:Uncharacterized protein n=1 Tax=Corchorus capsularis TaxID=210143 RepID=A0A1R3J673_COCAP|nr:hypothetical protein CCACVL1_07413 [Corchorus capsularis]